MLKNIQQRLKQRVVSIPLRSFQHLFYAIIPWNNGRIAAFHQLQHRIS
jgi:hypothetical protein